jgi:hypothetical protein
VTTSYPSGTEISDYVGVLAAGILLFIFSGTMKRKSTSIIELSLLKNRIFILPFFLYFHIQVCNTGAMMANLSTSMLNLAVALWRGDSCDVVLYSRSFGS